MATPAKIYGHSIIFSENVRIVAVDTLGNKLEGVKLIVTNNGNTYHGVTNELGYYDFFITDTAASNNVTINYSAKNEFEFDPGEDFFSSPVIAELKGIYVHEIEILKNSYINPNPSNNFNFVRWHESSNFHISDSKLGSRNESQTFSAITDSVDSYLECSIIDILPNNYERGVNPNYQPPFISGDEISFVLNFHPNFFKFGVESLSIAVINRRGEVVADNIAIESIYCNDARLYWVEFEFPQIKNTTDYRFAIYNNENGIVYYLSNPFRVESEKRRYPKLRYRNSCSSYGYAYSCLLGIYTEIRVDLNVIEQQPEIEIKQYREHSSGYLRNQKTQTAKVLKLESFMFDNESSDAMLALCTHDDITLNDKTLEIKSSYKIAYNKLNKKWKGEIEVYDQGYSTINLHGNQAPPNIGSPPSENSGEPMLDELEIPIIDETGEEILLEIL